MKYDLFRRRYKKMDVKDEDIKKYAQTIKRFEAHIEKDITDSTIEDIKHYMSYLVNQKENTYQNVIHFARYYYYINMKNEYIFMTRYFNSIGVLENIIKRLSLIDEKTDDLIKELVLPPFGTSTEELPQYTKDFMDKLTKYLPKTVCHKVLAGNNHQIPKEAFDKEVEFYKNSKSLDAYLKDKHKRKVQELTNFYKKNKVWFEQVITQDVIDYVASNQEILSGVLKGDQLYITKIPYDVNGYLNSDNNKEKRYYACHCSFVRDNIINGTESIDKDWCYCSAGFAKYPFEVIFGQELKVKLLKTPLDGDTECRFVIDLSDIEYKK